MLFLKKIKILFVKLLYFFFWLTWLSDKRCEVLNSIHFFVFCFATDANHDVNSAVVNASIGEASMTRESTSHLEVAGVLTDDTVSDNASTRAIAGASLTGSLSGSGGVGPMNLNQHK